MNAFTCILLALLLLQGCDRSKNPILSRPDTDATSITLQSPQIDNANFPDCRAFVLVTNQADQAITDFQIGNFTILENGNPTVVTNVQRTSLAEPLYVVLCMDRSGSMYGTPTTDANNAAIQLIDQLGANDYMEIIDFSTEASVVQGFTTSKDLLKQKINAAEADGLTAAYDAIGQAAKDLKQKHGRKFIIAMTDGLDNSSVNYTTPQAATTEVNKSGIAAHIVGLGYSVDTASLQNIADSTQGRYLDSPTSSQLAAQFNQIWTLMQNLIEIDFRTRTGGIRDLDVYLNYGTFTASTRRRYGY